MKVVNKKTGKDVTSYYLQYMEGIITKEEFEKLADIRKCDCWLELDSCYCEINKIYNK